MMLDVFCGSRDEKAWATDAPLRGYFAVTSWKAQLKPEKGAERARKGPLEPRTRTDGNLLEADDRESKRESHTRPCTI